MKQIFYKLTDTKGQTRGGTQWGEGIAHVANGEGNCMCTSGVIHVYDHPLKAIMFDPVHANFGSYLLWECECSDPVADDWLKIGVKRCKTLRTIPAPEITTEQRVRFAILVALEVHEDRKFTDWAQDWLSGKNRSMEAAEAAEAAEESMSAAMWAARAAMWAARAARWAAVGAVRTAIGAASDAAESAAWTAVVAASDITQQGPRYVSIKHTTLDFVSLIQQATV